jgi:hypothetical protein
MHYKWMSTRQVANLTNYPTGHTLFSVWTCSGSPHSYRKNQVSNTAACHGRRRNNLMQILLLCLHWISRFGKQDGSCPYFDPPQLMIEHDIKNLVNHYEERFLGSSERSATGPAFWFKSWSETGPFYWGCLWIWLGPWRLCYKETTEISKPTCTITFCSNLHARSKWSTPILRQRLIQYAALDALPSAMFRTIVYVRVC